MLDPKKKQRIIKKYRTHEHDTGSSEVQIAILTEEVKELTKHLKEHKHDFSSRKGLVKKVNDRRRLLRYLEREDVESYNKIIDDLKLKAPRKLHKGDEDDFIVAEDDDTDEDESGSEDTN